MYVVGISGSPRKNANTSMLVKEILKHVNGETKFISLANLDLHPCRNCDRCHKEKIECIIKDDIPQS